VTKPGEAFCLKQKNAISLYGISTEIVKGDSFFCHQKLNKENMMERLEITIILLSTVSVGVAYLLPKLARKPRKRNRRSKSNNHGSKK